MTRNLLTVMPHESLSLPSKVVHGLFPFHVLIDIESSEILSVGDGLKQVSPVDFIGDTFDYNFEITRPGITDLTLEVIRNHARSSIVLQVRGTEVVLRGQFLLPRDEQMLFVGSVLVKSSESLDKLHLSLGVFPPFDLTPDVVIMHKFREIENKDQKQRAHHLLEMSRSRDELSEHANTDQLTNLANRRGFWAKGSKILSDLVTMSPTRILLVLLDLDGFKEVNDQYGHEAGDDILRETAERLAGCVGTRGLAGRLGGDEFLAILILDEFENSEARVQEILTALSMPFNRKHQQLPIRASIGVSEINSGDTLEKVIHQADVAMYEGRSQRRGMVSWFSEEIQSRLDKKEEMQRALKDAIRNREIEPFFQPIVKLSDSTLSSFEALARWHDPRLGSVSPATFIALAVEIGLLAELDKQILEQSLDQLVKWHAQGKYYSIHVNLSAPSLHPGLVGDVIDALQSRSLEPRYLTLELTETTILDNTSDAQDILDTLSDAGVKIQLDDFGTGYSSLSHIRDFPVSGIKIDRSFVVDAHISEKSRALLKSVVAIAQNLHLDIVAEGIETHEQLNFLHDLGCHYGQGYYIGKPQRAETCERVFKQLQQKAA